MHSHFVVRHRLATTLLTLAAMASSCQSARDRSAAAVRAELGDSTQPSVAFLRDSTHLAVHLKASALAALSDSAFGTQARHVAQVALQAYPGAASVDSVSVLAGEEAVPDFAFRIVRSRTFASRDLR